MSTDPSVATLVILKAPEEVVLPVLGLPTMQAIGSIGAPTRKVYPLKKEVTVVGREGECDILLSHLTVSRIHFKVMKVAEGYRLLVAETVNGVLVNDAEVQDVILHDGDRIQIGSYHLMFSCE